MRTTNFVKLRSEDVHRTLYPTDVLRMSLYDSMRPRNVQVIRTLHECYITKVVSVAQQVDDMERGDNNYLP